MPKQKNLKKYLKNIILNLHIDMKPNPYLIASLVLFCILTIGYAWMRQSETKYKGAYTDGVIRDTDYYDAGKYEPCESSICFLDESAIGVTDTCGRVTHEWVYLGMHPLENGRIPDDNFRSEIRRVGK
jgi:hypothetical protein